VVGCPKAAEQMLVEDDAGGGRVAPHETHAVALAHPLPRYNGYPGARRVCRQGVGSERRLEEIALQGGGVGPAIAT
jgi:hypothetical protein